MQNNQHELMQMKQGKVHMTHWNLQIEVQSWLRKLKAKLLWQLVLLRVLLILQHKPMNPKPMQKNQNLKQNDMQNWQSKKHQKQVGFLQMLMMQMGIYT